MTTQASPHLLILDQTVENYQVLLSGVPSNFDVVYLEPNQNGIEQISAILAERTGLQTLHILSHGSDGSLALGNSLLNGSTLNRHAPSIMAWAKALAPQAEIFLYGCNVAQTLTGQQFVNALSELTGAAIAASTTLTGATPLGGAWDLAYRTGSIHTPLAFSVEAQEAYPAVLVVAIPNLLFAASINGNNTNIFTIDSDTGNAAQVGQLTNVQTFAVARVIGTNANGDAEGRLYFIENNTSAAANNGGTRRIGYWVDSDTVPNGVTTFIGNVPTAANGGPTADFLKMAQANDGTIYAIADINGVPNLYTIGTGNIFNFTALGAIAGLPTGSGDMAFRPVPPGSPSTELFVSSQAGNAVGIYSVNLATQTATQVGQNLTIAPGVGALGFGENGNLYISSSVNGIRIFEINPNTGTLVNPDGTPVSEGNDLNDFASLPTLTQQINLEVIAGIDLPPTVRAGDQITFTLQVRNTDPTLDVRGASFTSTLPPELTNVTWQAQGGAGVTFPGASSGTGNQITNLVNLNAGTTVNYVVTATVAVGTPENTNLVVSGQADLPAGLIDNNPLNNTAQDTTVVVDGSTPGGCVVGTPINGNNRNNRLVGATGIIDTIRGFGGNDILLGLGCPDLLIGGAGNDSLNGGAANDQLRGGEGRDRLDGEAGNDRLWGDAGNDRMRGGQGNDNLFGGIGNDLQDGGFGSDRLNGDDGADILSGGRGNDRLLGGNQDDQLDGGDENDRLFGQNGNDFCEGGLGDDYLDGGNGADILVGAGGADFLGGAAGNDRLNGGNGNDTLEGGADNDFLNGSNGLDFLLGNAGNDTLFGGLGIDILNGGAGNDFLAGDDDNDSLRGGDGNDLMRGGGGNDAMFGGLGNDRFNGGVGNDFMRGDQGNDQLRGAGGDDRALGLEGNDLLNGGAGADVLNGGTGNDRIFGGSGNDFLKGAQGNDIMACGTGNDNALGDQGDDQIQGESGNDRLAGGIGNDTLDGGIGIDTLNGGIGNDSLTGGDGNDNLRGAGGDDFLSGGLGDDSLLGLGQNDIVHGDEGNDQIFGNQGNDNLSGGAGNDTLLGSIGIDTLSGQGGADLIVGGRSRDLLAGGGGADVFEFDISDNATRSDSVIGQLDRIQDFNQVEGDRFRVNFAAINSSLPGRLFNAGAINAVSLRAAVEQVYQDRNVQQPGNQPLAIGHAVLFAWQQASYLVVNNRVQDYNPANDLLINVTGITLKAGDQNRAVLVTGDYFTA